MPSRGVVKPSNDIAFLVNATYFGSNRSGSWIGDWDQLLFACKNIAIRFQLRWIFITTDDISAGKVASIIGIIDERFARLLVRAHRNVKRRKFFPVRISKETMV